MTNLSDLTPREVENIPLVPAGRTNKTFAAPIDISEKTIEFYMDNKYLLRLACVHIS